jgi:hypothetical protein
VVLARRNHTVSREIAEAAVREVSDAFLLTMAEIAAALAGLFLVGIFFFVETGFRQASAAVVAYFKASTRIVLVLYAIPIGVSLTLVTLDLVWSQSLFAVLSVLLVAANFDTVLHIRAFKATQVVMANEAAGTAAVVALVLIPWLLGGIDPSREDLTWSILLSFAAGFLSISALALSAFDVARPQASPTEAIRRRVIRRSQPVLKRK